MSLPDCTPTQAPANPESRSTSGATVVANNSLADFALLQLTEDPKNLISFTPFYLGWDRSGNSGTGGVGIHHPAGDVKKISAYTITPQSTQYLSNTVNATKDHWRVTWSSGTTERLSSGSPLINGERRIIGQLHGGSSACTAYMFHGLQYGPDSPDWYGKFSVSWTSNGATDNRRKLRPWLDPAGTNPQTLDGTFYATISGPFYISDCNPKTYSVFTILNNIPWTWTCSSNLTQGWGTGNVREFSIANCTGVSQSYGWIAVSYNGIEVARKTVLLTVPSASGSGTYSTSVHPNPVSSVLQVDIVESEENLSVTSDRLLVVRSESARSAKQQVYDVRLFNIQGTQVRQAAVTGRSGISMDTSGLPNGIYMLCVHDGSSNPPQTQNVVISH
jgi:hypothetical protein